MGYGQLQRVGALHCVRAVQLFPGPTAEINQAQLAHPCNGSVDPSCPPSPNAQLNAQQAQHGSSLADHPVPKQSLRQTNTSLRDKLNLSRSQNKVCSHAYNACSQLSRLHRMYHFQHTDIVFRQSRLVGSQFLSVDR